MSDDQKPDYKKTLCLPQTSFPMKANLTQREPQTLKFWEEKDAYQIMISTGGEKGVYCLHDGPPYANGNIHLGHSLNKILKDIVVKSRNMAGYRAEYVPGWDCHGLPIEHKVEQELGDKKGKLPPHAVRKRCRDYAAKFVNIQRKEFKRLGVLGVWDKPYLSMDPAYEAATARELVAFMERGAVVRSKKPIHWCASCGTALAEAEVEYADHSSPSVFVRFPLRDPALAERVPGLDPGSTFVVIWTTTPWTLPDNMGVALHPDYEYVAIEHQGNRYILAEALAQPCASAFGWSEYSVVARFKGAALENLNACHPFYDRVSRVVLADYVTLDAGTGCVHTAPGHGQEDYETGLRYGLEVYSPIDDAGRFLESVQFFAGMTVWEANPKVIEKLKETGNLLASSTISHSYPHCWRCKNPVFFRATTQWFISMDKDDLRGRALAAIRDDVDWIPSWGEARIYSMIENRPDWCISRQRLWGVPIIALLCEKCGEAWFDGAWGRDIADRFAKHPTGCDYWFETDIADIVPQGLSCSCGGKSWKKETDILDVWFDSGTSFAAVVEERPECRFPADLYLEGSDQHRGWFHSSLLASIGNRGVAPYKAVLTHGYVVDGEGRKMSKSVGNVEAPGQVIDQHGAEILRMWVASVDYREDIRISHEILNRQVDAYRRLRNTCRYILGNLGDFNPEQAVADTDMDPLDRFALDLVTRAHERVQQAYEEYEFHKVFHTLHNLCSTDLSAFYLDILKDRLYASGKDSRVRRSAQTAMWRILMLLLRDMAPILSFTAEEVFQFLPEALKPQVTTVLALREKDTPGLAIGEDERAAWELLLAIRAEVSRAIEPLRKAGDVGHGLDCKVSLYLDAEKRRVLSSLGDTDLRAVFIVSQLTVAELDLAPAEACEGTELTGLRVTVGKAEGDKCLRCWIYDTNLGSDPNLPGLCPRCTAVLQAGEGC